MLNHGSGLSGALHDTKAVITTSWDDGHPYDLRLAELLDRYGIPATFYIPTANEERHCMSRRQIKEIARSFDVGSHSHHHVDLSKIPTKMAETEVIESKRKLEEIIGRRVFTFCYPWGRFNSKIVSIVRKSGFFGARTVRVLTRSVGDPFRMGTTVKASRWKLVPYIARSVVSQDFRLFQLMLRDSLFLKGWDQSAIACLDFIVKHGGVWHLWGHSWEIHASNDWVRLENVLRHARALSKETAKLDNSRLLRKRLSIPLRIKN